MTDNGVRQFEIDAEGLYDIEFWQRARSKESGERKRETGHEKKDFILEGGIFYSVYFVVNQACFFRLIR